MATKSGNPAIYKINPALLTVWLAVLCTLLTGCKTASTAASIIPCGDTNALIKAIVDANSDPSTFDVIELDYNCDYILTESYHTSRGATGLPYITSPMKIIGNGSRIMRSDKDGIEKFRIFLVTQDGHLELLDMTLENGYAYYEDDQYDVEKNSGGAIRNSNLVILTKVTIQKNRAYAVTGGIFNEGKLTINDSILRWNDQDANAYLMGGAAAIHNHFDSSAYLDGVTVNENGFSGNWNAITNSETSDFTMVNSTISGNAGIGINNDGDLDMMFVTIANNARGIWSVNYGIPKVKMTGILFQNNIDCNIGPGVLVINQYNMDSDGSCGVLYTVSPASMLLDGLASNGGYTETHALLAGSPAIDAVTNAFSLVCTITVDQRDITRPQLTNCDIGAYEYDGNSLTMAGTPPNNPAPVVTHTPTPTATPEPTATFTPTPEQSASRCELFDGENGSLTMFDIPYGTTDLSLYVLWPHPVWGLEEAVEGDSDPWDYAATLGSTTALQCSYQGYTGRLYCDFKLPEAALGASLVLNVYINGCDDPIYTHTHVSVFEPVLTCSQNVTKEQCGDFGGTYNMTSHICRCP